MICSSCRNQVFQIYLQKTVGFPQIPPQEPVVMQMQLAQALAHHLPIPLQINQLLVLVNKLNTTRLTWAHL